MLQKTILAKNVWIFRLTMLLLLITSSSNKQETAQIASDTKAALVSPRNLKNVVSHFRRTGDTIGVRAAQFLIDNIENLGSVDIKTDRLICDISQMTDSYLIKSIKNSLDVSRNDLMNKEISEQLFFEYILPHRLANEPLTNWKSACRMRHRDLHARTKGKPLAARAQTTIVKVNKSLIGTFRYNGKDQDAGLKSWQELDNTRTGDCWAMTNAITFPLRAMGIPVTVDFTTGWANANGGTHAWNVLVLDSNSKIPFLGYEASPPTYHPFRIYKDLYRHPAKVFRKKYSKGSRSIREYVQNLEDIPVNLDFDRAEDVSAQYMPTKDVKVTCANLRGSNVSYLSTFSSGSWTPAFWSKGVNGIFKFDKMGIHGLYIMSTFSDNECVPMGYPFSIRNAKPHIFRPLTKKISRMVIRSISSLEMNALGLYGLNITTEEFYKTMGKVYNKRLGSAPKDDSTYSLYYWDKKWILVQKTTKQKFKDLVFENVPANSIYRLDATGQQSASRVFTYENSMQFWW